MDRQSIAFREAGPADWWDGMGFDPVPDDVPILSPDDWEALRFDGAVGWDVERDPTGARDPVYARRLLAARVDDPGAPDDDATAYDDLIPARHVPSMRPLTAGRLFVPWLVDAARSTGYPVIVVPGAATRGHGGMAIVEGVVGHHTAGPKTGEYPSMIVVRDGRAGLAGPLCNLGLGRSGTIYVVAAGLAYHAGASAHAGFVDLNSKFLGIEAEDDGDGVWTPAQLDAYPKLVGALLRYMRRGVERYVSHRTCARPAGRKPDPKGIDDGWMRQRAAAFMSGGAPAPAPAPAPTPARTPRPQEVPNMIEREIPRAGRSGRINAPTGPGTSKIAAETWVSVSVPGGARVELWFQDSADADGPAPGSPGSKPIDVTIKSARRFVVQAPTGTEFIDFRITPKTAAIADTGSLLVEFVPYKA